MTQISYDYEESTTLDLRQVSLPEASTFLSLLSSRATLLQQHIRGKCQKVHLSEDPTHFNSKGSRVIKESLRRNTEILQQRTKT